MALKDFMSAHSNKIALFALIITIIATRAPYLGDPTVIFDDQLYSFIGNKMLEGKLPYVDFWDRKPFGLFAIFAITHLIGGPGPVAYQIMASLFCLAGALLLWRIALRFTNPLTAAFCSLFYPLLMAQYGSQTAQSEVLFTPFILAMALFTLKGRESAAIAEARKFYLLAMAMGGLALQVKYTVAAVCLWFGLVALKDLYDREKAYKNIAFHALIFGLIGILPTALVALFYFSIGHYFDFVFANFLSIGLRKRAPDDMMLYAQVVLILPLLFLAAFGILKHFTAPKPNRAAIYWFALGWLIFSLIGLFIGTTVYTYYYAALTPIIIITLLPAINLRESFSRIIFVMFFAGGLYFYNPIARYEMHKANKENFSQLMASVRSNIGASKRPIYIYDGPIAVYGLLSNPLPSKYIYPDHLNNALEENALPHDPSKEAARILALRPIVILSTNDVVTVQNPKTERLVTGELKRHYRLTDTIKIAGRRIEIYRDKRPE